MSDRTPLPASKPDQKEQEQIMEYYKQQILLLKEKALLQASVREEKKLLVENSKLKKDIEDLKTLLQDTQKKKAAKLLMLSEVSKPFASQAAAPSGQSASQAAQKPGLRRDAEGRRRRERRGVRRDSAQAMQGASALTPDPTVDVSRLELRIGRVLSVRGHPEAESLYVQEVEVGEAAPRVVVSGLVKHLQPEQLQDRMAVLLCNIRPVKVRGVLSQARLLCAVNQEDMEPLEPPTGALPGDRVTFQGYPGEPERELNPKCRIWERLQPDLQTDAKGVATYKGVAFEVRGKGLCRAPGISNGGIK